MANAVLDGEVAPVDGRLPDESFAEFVNGPTRQFGFYVHVPYCATRCGYCDFNTYTAEELGPGVSRTDYAQTATSEVRFAGGVLAGVDQPIDTVFFGGGTPTLLPAQHLIGVLDSIRHEFGIAEGAEVTTEANPDSVTPDSLAQLRAGGFTRISFGMQSASPHVLAVLERTHTPDRARDAVQWAKDAGFEHVNVDLIYGTPSETADDFARSLDIAIATGVDHVSAYALVVEDGTRLGRRVARGEMPAPDDDVAAARYEVADRLLTDAGFEWYEVSNWARPGGECRHNLGYWSDGNWWGIGPGAHSHVAGVRWWNVKHPSAYTDRIAAGKSPALAREVLTPQTRAMERIMLGTRLRAGLALDAMGSHGRDAAARAALDGLVDPHALEAGRVVLTGRGRLLGDRVVGDLIDPTA